MMEWLWPIKTGKTFIDVNTIFHLAFWVWMGSNFCYMKLDVRHAIAAGIAISLVWEVFERFAEKRWANIWLHPESFVNAYLSDPLTSVIGILFAWYAIKNWDY